MVPLAAPVLRGAGPRGSRWKASHRAGSRSRPAGRRARGARAGTGLWRTWFAGCVSSPAGLRGLTGRHRDSGQGPCRNPCQTQVPRSVRIAAVATRAESPEEGRVSKPAPWSARRRLSDAGQHPASFGPRAHSATPYITTLPRGTARVRPSGLSFPTPRRIFPRGSVCGCLDGTRVRGQFTFPLKLTANRRPGER